MSEYIKKEDVINIIDKIVKINQEQKQHCNTDRTMLMWVGANDILLSVQNVIGDIPAADVRPVIYTEWILGFSNGVRHLECSNCHKEPLFSMVEDLSFCPYCGREVRNAVDTHNGLIDITVTGLTSTKIDSLPSPVFREGYKKEDKTRLKEVNFDSTTELSDFIKLWSIKRESIQSINVSTSNNDYKLVLVYWSE